MKKQSAHPGASRNPQRTLRRSLYGLGALLSGLALTFLGCRDVSAPGRAHVDIGGVHFDDYDSPDSVHYCPLVGCRDLTDDEKYKFWVVISSIQPQNGYWCQDMYNNLSTAIEWNKIKAATTFWNGSQLGATDLDDAITYIRSDLIESGPGAMQIPLGHEGLHQAGYGRYEGHQYDMDHLSSACFGMMM